MTRDYRIITKELSRYLCKPGKKDQMGKIQQIMAEEYMRWQEELERQHRMRLIMLAREELRKTFAATNIVNSHISIVKGENIWN